MREEKEKPPVFRMKRDRKPTLLILLLIILAGVLWFNKDLFLIKRKDEKRSYLEGGKVTLYIPSDNRTRLVAKAVEPPRPFDKRETALFVMDGLKKEGVIPGDVVVDDLAVGGDGIIYLNLSKKIQVDRGPLEELLMVYSVVNSLIASVRDARSVQFLIEGRPVYTINGLLYLYRPIELNRDLMEE